MFKGKRYLAAAAGAAAMLAPAGIALTGTAASAAASTTYQPAFSYQFASNNGNTWRVSDSPLQEMEAYQELGPGGVTLATKPDQPTSSPYADSGVIIDLGTIKANENSSGDLVPPVVDSTGSSVAVNLYFDTNGDGQYLSFSYNGYYEDPGGDTIVDSVSQPIPASEYKNYEAPTGTANKDPGGDQTEVWAWVGVSGSAAQTATVSKVTWAGGSQGGDLVKAVTSYPTGAVTGYGGKCLDDYHSSTANGTKIDLYSCNGTRAQAWTFQETGTTSGGTSLGYLVNAASSKCLNDAGYGGPGTKVIQWTCGSYSNELWQYWPRYREYSLYSGSKTVCLNDPGYSTANGTQQIVWSCPDTPNEQYSLPG